jgi:hypothetical protein
MLLMPGNCFVNKGVSGHKGTSLFNVNNRTGSYQRNGSGRISIALTKG